MRYHGAQEGVKGCSRRLKRRGFHIGIFAAFLFSNIHIFITRPDRIIVGEVRGAEAIDMLQCMNTGHDGSMSTGHANSGKDMLARLENMVLMGMEIPLMAIRQQIASGVDIIVHLGRLRDKSRRVLEITEIIGCENGDIKLNPLFAFEETGEDSQGNIIGKLRKKGGLLHENKLKAAGL